MPKFDNIEIKRVVMVKVWFTAKDWGLQNAMYGNVTALRLNQELERYVNRNEPRDVITMVMRSLMRHNEEFGSNGPEQHAFLEEVLDEIFKGKS